MIKPDWHHIDTLLLDMDGVLLDLAYDNWFWHQFFPVAFARHHRLSQDDANRQVQRLMEDNWGTLEWYSLDFWQRITGVDVVALKEQTRDRIAFRPQAQQFLAQLSSLGKRVLLTTNAHPETLRIKLETTGIDCYFDQLVSSADYGAAKEEQAFWQQLEQRQGVDAQRCFFLDDSLTVLDSARQFGVGHLYSIRQPDSARPPRAHTDPFPCVDNLLELLP